MSSTLFFYILIALVAFIIGYITKDLITVEKKVEVNIKRQKVKGDGNDIDADIDIDATETKQRRKIFNRKK